LIKRVALFRGRGERGLRGGGHGVSIIIALRSDRGFGRTEASVARPDEGVWACVIFGCEHVGTGALTCPAERSSAYGIRKR
jgi:hypothetical protein